MTLPDWLRRGLRSAAQKFLDTFLVLTGLPKVVPDEVLGEPIPEFSVLAAAVIAGGWAAFHALLVAAHNALEDNTRFPALLKAPPSPGLNPEPDPPAAPVKKAPAKKKAR